MPAASAQAFCGVRCLAVLAVTITNRWLRHPGADITVDDGAHAQLDTRRVAALTALSLVLVAASFLGFLANDLRFLRSATQ